MLEDTNAQEVLNEALKYAGLEFDYEVVSAWGVYCSVMYYLNGPSDGPRTVELLATMQEAGWKFVSHGAVDSRSQRHEYIFRRESVGHVA